MDDLYNKMILALPDDFFNGWELEDGDQVYLFKDIDDYTCSEKHGLYTIFDNLLANNGVTYTENWHYAIWIISDGLIRPIPSQKQLQSIIKQHWLKSDDTVKDYDVLVFFQDWFRARYGSNYTYGIQYKEIENESIDCIWLRYAMHVIYNKTWNGNAWVLNED